MSKIPKKYQGAYSIESRAAHGADYRELQRVDEFDIGTYKYIIYQDDHGEYWFENLIRVGKRFLSVEEAIFGKNKPKTYYRHH